MADHLPTVRKTLATPMLPLPARRTSTPKPVPPGEENEERPTTAR